MVLLGWFNLHSSNIALCPFEIKDNNGSVHYMFRTKCYFNMSCIERALNDLIKRNNSIQKKEEKKIILLKMFCVSHIMIIKLLFILKIIQVSLKVKT
jgi:hypothetical protein